MNLNYIIKNPDIAQLEKIKMKCIGCKFWFESSRNNLNALLGDFYNSRTFLDLFKSKIFEIRTGRSSREFIYSFVRNGGIVKVVFDRKKCISLLLAGKYYLFPKLKLFNIYPTDDNSIFLGCIHVDNEYKGMGIGKKLLISLERDLMDKGFESIETIGKRMTDDIDEEEFTNSPVIPIKFLIKNGFYIKKNEGIFPLLRLDLSSIVKQYLEEKVLIKNILLERGVNTPVVIKKD